jgi:DNA-binding ferritin-like protein (Dps family)
MATWRDEKKRYKQYKARKEQLPAGYREAIDSVERYALRFGPATGETVVTMLEDLAGIFEQGAKDGAPVREVVGADRVRFTEDFLEKYPASPWARREQQRLARTINDAERAGV